MATLMVLFVSVCARAWVCVRVRESVCALAVARGNVRARMCLCEGIRTNAPTCVRMFACACV